MALKEAGSCSHLRSRAAALGWSPGKASRDKPALWGEDPYSTMQKALFCSSFFNSLARFPSPFTSSRSPVHRSRDEPAGIAQRPSSARTSPGGPQKQIPQASRAPAQSGSLTSPDAQHWQAQKLPPGSISLYTEVEQSTSGSDLIKAGHVRAQPQSSQLPNGPRRPMSGGQSSFREASGSSSLLGGSKQRLRLPQRNSIDAAPERAQALGESGAEAQLLPALLQSASLAPAASSDHRQRPSTAMLTRPGSAARGLQLADGAAALLRTNSRAGAGTLRPSSQPRSACHALPFGGE